MSQENVEIVRDAYAQFAVTGRLAENATSDFVWDMSNFDGWPEQEVYVGVEGARTFLREWTEAWDDWELDIESLLDAGEQVVALVRQRGRSKGAGLPVDMSFAQVWTIRAGKHARMEMYSDPSRALEAVRLEG